MQALEFHTHIQNGIIQLPSEYAGYNNADARIIVLLDTPSPTKNGLQEAFEAAAQANVFKDIENPAEWQKKERNDWE